MSTTPAVFTQDLYNAFTDVHCTDILTYHICYGAAAMDIQMTPGPDRVIALMRLPTMKVRLCFTAGNDEECKAMLKRLDIYTQRGGG